MALEIMLACNDCNGNFTGFADAVEIEGVRLVGGRIAVRYDHGKAIRGASTFEGDDTLRFGRIRVPALAYCTWVGNWCWDCASVRAVHALRLLNYLAARPDWHCEEAPCEIFEAFNDRKIITPAEWKRRLTNEGIAEPFAALAESSTSTEASSQSQKDLEGLTSNLDSERDASETAGGVV